jgi:hypothetical protein
VAFAISFGRCLKASKGSRGRVAQSARAEAELTIQRYSLKVCIPADELKLDTINIEFFVIEERFHPDNITRL